MDMMCPYIVIPTYIQVLMGMILASKNETVFLKNTVLGQKFIKTGYTGNDINDRFCTNILNSRASDVLCIDQNILKDAMQF